MSTPDPDSKATRASLLGRLHDWNDNESWSEFHEIYGQWVLWNSQRLGLNETDAQDVRQEVFRHVAQDILKFKTGGRPGSFRRFLKQRTIWCAKNLLRSKDKAIPSAMLRAIDDESRTDPLDRLADPNINFEEADLRDYEEFLLERGLLRLRDKAPPRDYQVFDLRRRQGMAVEEIARIYKITENNVSVICTRLEDELTKITLQLKKDTTL